MILFNLPHFFYIMRGNPTDAELNGSSLAMSRLKRFYNRETIPFITISPEPITPSTLSWLAEILR